MRAKSSAVSRFLKASYQVSETSQVRAIFDRAIAIDDEGQRARFLNNVSSDPELILSVRQLLKSYESSGSFLDANVFGWAADSEENEAGRSIVGSQLGPYTIVEFLGEGSFGRVFKARQKAPLNRTVAIKMVKPGLCSNEVLARFDVERQSLAMMNHPGIAKVFSANQIADGRPFFAMEFVDGVSVTDYARQHRCTVTERLELVADVCDALQHAHEKDVVHRDIKPSNILISDLDGRRRVKLIDFGVSKILSPDSASAQTHAGQLLGTPRYMSPEQQACRHDEIDFRSDIFSLGVVLFELLTGLPPDPATATGSSKPSECIGDDFKQLTGQEISSEQLRTVFDPNVDWIVQKSIASSPEDRYPTAAAVGQDIRKHLVGEKVAQRSSLASRLKKQSFFRVAVASSLTACGLLAFSLRGQAKVPTTVEPAPINFVDVSLVEENNKLEKIAERQANALRKSKLKDQAEKVGELLKAHQFQQSWFLCKEVLALAESCDERDALSSNIHVYAGRLQYSMQNYEQAIPYFEHACLLAEKYPISSGGQELYRRKAELLAIKAQAFRSSPHKLKGVKDELIALIATASEQHEIGPKDLNSCRIHLAGVQTLLRDEGVLRTIQDIYETRRQSPESISPQKVLGLELNVAYVYFMSDNEEALNQLLKSILEKHGEFLKCGINPFLQLANFCSKQGMHDKGCARLKELLYEFEQDDFSDPVREIHCGLGLLEMRRNPPVAIDHLKLAVAQDPIPSYEFFALPRLAQLYAQQKEFGKSRVVVHRIGRYLENSGSEAVAVDVLLSLLKKSQRTNNEADLAIEAGKVLTDHLVKNQPNSWTTYAHLIELGKVFQAVGEIERGKACFRDGFAGLKQTVDQMPASKRSLLDYCLELLAETSAEENKSGLQNSELIAEREWWTKYQQQFKR